MIYLGIDPGKSGAIVALDEYGKPFDGGVIKLSETDADVFEFLERIAGYGECRAMIEKVHASPPPSAKRGRCMGTRQAFCFGKSAGFLYGVLTAVRVPLREVSPQRWQKAMDCQTHGDKNISKAAAQRLWPSVKITHANADAMLIAEYGRAVWSGAESRKEAY